MAMIPAGSDFVEVPIEVKSTMNLREHWGRRHRRSQAQRKAVWAFWRRTIVAPPPQWDRITVVLTRIYASQPFDTDNLAASMKAVRDQVAQELKVDDGDPRVSWVYEQEKGPSAVKIAVHYYRTEEA